MPEPESPPPPPEQAASPPPEPPAEVRPEVREAADSPKGSRTEVQPAEGEVAGASSSEAEGDAKGEVDTEGEGEGGAAEAKADQGPAPEGGAPTGEGAPAKKRRRRRRRRKGAGPTEAGASVPPDAAGASVPPEHAADSPPAGPAEADAKPGEKPEGDKGKKKKRRNKKEHAHAHAPRERSAFSVGDVVFGKILEITDEVIFVDLAGKGKGIFDRRELDLPDEPPEEPPASVPPRKPAERAASTTPPDSSANEQLEMIEAALPAGFAAPVAQPEAVAPVMAVDDPPAEVEPPPVTHRRIVKAKALLEAESTEKPPEAEPPADPPPPEAQATDAAGDADPDAPPVETPTEAASAEPEPAPAPHPMYAPPVVLELGAHFVALVHNDGARGGLVVLTRHPRRVSQAKAAASKAHTDRTTVSGLVTGVVKGGVEVDVEGLRAFAPGSHMDLHLGVDLHPWIGKRLDFYVTQYGKRGRDCVLSRRPMLEAEAKTLRDSALAKLSVGSVVDGTVRSVVQFGAFLDIGGVEGLVPLQEMSHNRSESPSDVFKPGDTVPVKITKIDDRGKVWLSRKAAAPDPWLELVKKYAVGSKHTGKVVRLQPFGVFVELESGIDGLIHTADLFLVGGSTGSPVWKRIEHPSEVVKVSEPIDVVVAHVDAAAHKIGLHPALPAAAAEEPRQRVTLHKPVKVAVVGVEQGGLVVRILGATGRHARGYITAAATGTPRGTELRKPFPVGTQLEAKVIDLDPKRGEVKLSIKALREETERTAYQQYRAQVTRESKFGTFADLLAKKTTPQK